MCPWKQQTWQMLDSLALDFYQQKRQTQRLLYLLAVVSAFIVLFCFDAFCGSSGPTTQQSPTVCVFVWLCAAVAASTNKQTQRTHFKREEKNIQKENRKQGVNIMNRVALHTTSMLTHLFSPSATCTTHIQYIQYNIYIYINKWHK